MDRIDQLNIFLRVAQSGSFTLAAEQLALPRPTVSLAVQQLEARLGARLLHRTTRKVSLTQDGEALLERIPVLLADMEELEQQFRPQAGPLSGRIRVDMPSRIARRLVAPALPQFLAQHPALQLELGSSDRLIDLVHEGVDCALRVGTPQASSLVARPVGMVPIISCASPTYLAHHGAPASPADLAQHQAVHYAAPGSSRAAPWEWTDHQGVVQRCAMGGSITVNNVETYIACALAGLGLIQIPAFDVREHLAAGELVPVLHGWPAPAMPMHLVYPHRRQLSQRLQAFAGWLQPLLQHEICGPAQSTNKEAAK